MNGKNVNHIGDALSEVRVADELNMLSYLVRKYPEEAMAHLSFSDMISYIKKHNGFSTPLVNWNKVLEAVGAEE